MRDIKGRKYYISLGYIDKDVSKENGFKFKFMDILKMETDNGTLYVDDSDKDNIIVVPLVPVNDIQKSKNVFKFRVLVHPFKVKWLNKEEHSLFKINTIGLFEMYRESGIEYIRHVGFFETTIGQVFTSRENAKTILIEVQESEIMGVEENAKQI